MARPVAGASFAACVLVLGICAVIAPDPPGRPDDRPNIVLIVTDDQTVSSLTEGPRGMPWLTAALDDPSNGWRWFENAVVSTPSCCPSRASILTGRTAWSTGVVDNGTGDRLDDSATLATALHGAGYRTALVGKYLNGYPWGAPVVPPGWDRWLAKLNMSAATTYRGYELVDQGLLRVSAPTDYAPEALAREALSFVRSAPIGRPWFLYFAPPTPHRPAAPAPQDEHVDPMSLAPPPMPAESLNHAANLPPWMRALPRLDGGDALTMARWRGQERVALAAVDRFLEELFDVLRWRGDLDSTVVAFVSDNGFSFGERRWIGKLVPYEPVIRVPLGIRLPDGRGRRLEDLVSNADIAPTLAAIAGVRLAHSPDGLDLGPLLLERSSGPDDRVIALGWPGSPQVPAWVGVRAADSVLIRWSDGTQELYDLESDPEQRRNLVAEPEAAPLLRRSAAFLPPFPAAR